MCIYIAHTQGPLKVVARRASIIKAEVSSVSVALSGSALLVGPQLRLLLWELTYFLPQAF